MVSGCIDSDIPFGSYDLPVSIADDNGKVAALVDVDDGIGSFAVQGRTGAVSVDIDPDRTVLLYERRVDRTDGPVDCSQ